MYYSSRQSGVLEREEVKFNEADYEVFGEKTIAKKQYVSPSLSVVRVAENARQSEIKQRVVTPEEEAEENMTPSKTTMQFINMESEDTFEAVRKSEKAERQRYSIGSKSKLFIALYAIAFVAIFSLVIINATMLKNVDRTIKNSTARIETLKSQNSALSDTLDYVRSDDFIISEAQTRGLN